jgi:hypothetical protein
MALVKAPDPAEREYAMDVIPLWNRGGSSATIELRFSTADGRPVRDFVVVHEREVHLIVIERQFRHFAHLHPTRRPDGAFVVDVDLPTQGAYMLFADFVPSSGAAQLLQRMLLTPGSPVPAVRLPAHQSSDRQSAHGLRFAAVAEELRLGTPALLTFTISDEKESPITDLEPYLGAPAHLFITSEDFQDAAHSHPLETAFGPQVRFLVRFAREGRYRAWLQTQHRGRVITTDWTFDVPAR